MAAVWAPQEQAEVRRREVAARGAERMRRLQQLNSVDEDIAWSQLVARYLARTRRTRTAPPGRRVTAGHSGVVLREQRTYVAGRRGVFTTTLERGSEVTRFRFLD